MTERLFMALILSVLTYLAFASGIAELAAVGVLTALLAFYVWCDICRMIDKRFRI